MHAQVTTIHRRAIATLLCTLLALVLAAPQPVRAAEISLRLVTWNVWGLPLGLSSSNRSRLTRIAELVHGLEPRPDIVAFQELWLAGDAALLQDALADDYAWVGVAGTWLGTRPGGLLLLVRRDWLVLDYRWEPFRESACWAKVWEGDGISSKGVLSVTIERDGQRLTVIDTHLQSQYGEHRYEDVRRAQLAELRAAADRSPATQPTIVLGDLNTTPDDSILVAPIAGWSDLTEAYRQRHRGARTHDVDGWIDYVFVRDGDWSIHDRSLELLPAPPARREEYSDHSGLDVGLQLTIP